MGFGPSVVDSLICSASLVPFLPAKCLRVDNCFSTEFHSQIGLGAPGKHLAPWHGALCMCVACTDVHCEFERRIVWLILSKLVCGLSFPCNVVLP